MELVAVVFPLTFGGIYVIYKPTRAGVWNWIAAWAAANRDAAITREERRREYLSAEVAR